MDKFRKMMTENTIVAGGPPSFGLQIFGRKNLFIEFHDAQYLENKHYIKKMELSLKN